MADNFTTPVPDATVLATKDIAGAHHPKSLIAKWDGTDADLATQTTLAAVNAKLAASVAVTQSGSWNVGVTGAFWQATQPVSLAALPALAAGANNIGDVDILTVNGVAPAFGTGPRGATVQRVTIATDDIVPVSDNGGSLTVDGSVSITDISAGDYETVAAGQTAQAIGATGAAGDYIAGLLVIPATLSPGNVLLLDNATSITVFAGGTNSVPSLIPFFIPLGIKSASGAWKVTSGANVSVVASGNFT